MTNPSKAWWSLAGAILCEVTGSLSLKAALDAPVLYALVVAGFAGAFAFLAATVKSGMALGVAYGVWGATGVALTAVMSFVLFGEPLSWLMGVGIVIVIAGVLCIELGSQAARRRADHADADHADTATEDAGVLP